MFIIPPCMLRMTRNIRKPISRMGAKVSNMPSRLPGPRLGFLTTIGRSLNFSGETPSACSISTVLIFASFSALKLVPSLRVATSVSPCTVSVSTSPASMALTMSGKDASPASTCLLWLMITMGRITATMSTTIASQFLIESICRRS